MSSYTRITSDSIRKALTKTAIKWTEKYVHDVRMRWNAKEQRPERYNLVDLFAPAETIADALFCLGLVDEAMDIMRYCGTGQLVLFRSIETRVA